MGRTSHQCLEDAVRPRTPILQVTGAAVTLAALSPRSLPNKTRKDRGFCSEANPALSMPDALGSIPKM